MKIFRGLINLFFDLSIANYLRIIFYKLFYTCMFGFIILWIGFNTKNNYYVIYRYILKIRDIKLIKNNTTKQKLQI